MRRRETLILASRELREALRSRWFVVASASFLVLSLGLALLGLAGARRSGMAGFDRTTAGVLNVALMFVPLLGLTLGALGVAGELEDGSLAMILAQPVTRAEVFAGKYLGLLGAVAASILVGFGVTGAAIGWLGGGGDAGPFLTLVGVTLLLAAVTLAIGTWLSVALRSRARAIGAAFATWLFLVYLSDLGTIGLTLARSLAPGQVFLLGLLNPVQQARVLGTLALSGRPDVLGPVGVYGVDHFGWLGLRLLLVAALATTAALALLASQRRFRKAVIA
jgi:Cu-processing system permease protein